MHKSFEVGFIPWSLTQAYNSLTKVIYSQQIFNNDVCQGWYFFVTLFKPLQSAGIVHDHVRYDKY